MVRIKNTSWFTTAADVLHYIVIVSNCSDINRNAQGWGFIGDIMED